MFWMTIGFPRCFSAALVAIRVPMSVPPPATKGTIIVMGLAGYTRCPGDDPQSRPMREQATSPARTNFTAYLIELFFIRPYLLFPFYNPIPKQTARIDQSLLSKAT
jgi:hypothetical protein